MPGATRLFVSGNRSQVGKSSVCLGILGSLLKSGYSASDIAYIKPTTQCTKPTLVAAFCERNGIRNRPIGPVVYYSGFTREFLNGETAGCDVLLQRVRDAVDEVAAGVKVCVVDGVGYPSVGSIVGLDNATVARAIGAAVVLVAKAGVGDAIDSFNLDATWFLAHGAPVVGAIYNR
jgi:BioD-like phosphotransacetylase family protein